MTANSSALTQAATSGDDIIMGTAGADTLDGGLGNDTLVGLGGDDLLVGGTGEGDDTYVFAAGWGNDELIDMSGANVLDFSGLVPGDLTFSRSGSDLDVVRKGSADHLVVDSFFDATGASWSATFGDGTVLSAEQVGELVSNNRPPLALDDFVALAEDGVATRTGNVLVNDSDEDGQAPQVTNPGTYVGTYGTLTLNADGTFSYTLNNGSPAVQALAQGMTLTDTFSYTITDNDATAPATATAVLTAAITGTNDAPTVSTDFFALTEDSTVSANGNVLANDADVDTGTVLQVAAPGTYIGSLGDLDIAQDGSFTYQLRDGAIEVQSLGRETVATDTFLYGASDTIATSQGQVEFTVQGTNDAPIVAIALADQTATASTAWSWSIPAGSFSDIDAGDGVQLTATLADGSPLPAWLVFDSATNTFSGIVPSDAITALDIRVTATDYVISSGSTTGSLSISDDFTLSFQGGTLGAPVAVNDSVALVEDGNPLAVGNVLANDIDPDGKPLQVANPGTYVGTYGTLTLNADGTFGYVLDNSSAAVQSLPQGVVVSDTFTYVAADGTGSGTGTLTAAITGTNDAPVVTNETVALMEDATVTASGNVLGNDTDADTGTVLQIAAPGSYVGSLGDLQIAQDGTFTYQLRNGAIEVQSLGRETVATDTFDYGAGDTIAISQGHIDFDVQGANDAPIVEIALADQTATASTAWSWSIPAGSFSDIDVGDGVQLTATLADGSPLPAWLVFDSATNTFSGIVPSTAVTALDIRVTATDFVIASGSTVGSLSVSDDFLLSFVGGNTKGKGNEGVGNGEDPPPPGHDYNWNDGPGTSPGNPGSQGGGNGHGNGGGNGHAYGRAKAMPAMDHVEVVGVAAQDLNDLHFN